MTTKEIIDTRIEIRGRLKAVCEIVRQTWKQQTGKELPDSCRLKVQYAGSDGRGGIEATFLQVGDQEIYGLYDPTDPRRMVAHALHDGVDPKSNLIRLVDALAKWSGHGLWRKYEGGQGEVVIDVNTGVIEHFVHETPVVRWEPHVIDVAELLQ